MLEYNPVNEDNIDKGMEAYHPLVNTDMLEGVHG